MIGFPQVVMLKIKRLPVEEVVFEDIMVLEKEGANIIRNLNGLQCFEGFMYYGCWKIHLFAEGSDNTLRV